MPKRIGVDCDGVLSNFFTAYEDLCVKVAQKDLFPARYPEIEPPTWNWPEHYGYTKETVSEVWKLINASPTFWESLKPLPGAVDAMKQLHRVSKVEGAHVFFISDRAGNNPKRQTERWLYNKGFIEYPTVLLGSDKASLINVLDLDFFIDDKPSTVTAVCQMVRETQSKLKGHVYCPDYAYNREGRHPDAVVVKDITEALKREGLWKE